MSDRQANLVWGMVFGCTLAIFINGTFTFHQLPGVAQWVHTTTLHLFAAMMVATAFVAWVLKIGDRKEGNDASESRRDGRPRRVDYR